MQLIFVLLTLLLLVVALFAVQNADPVTVRFLHWRLDSSVAVVTLAATATGALIAGLIGAVARLRRWTKKRGAAPTGGDPPRAAAPPPIIGPSSRSAR